MRIHVPATQAPADLHAARNSKRAGTTSRSFVPIRTILSLFALVSLMGMPFVVLMPIFAARVLHGGPHTLGFLMGAMGIGALVAALSLAARKSVLGLGQNDRHLRGGLWPGPDRLRPLALLLALHAR